MLLQSQIDEDRTEANYSQVALKSDSDLAELGGKGYVKFDLSAREFDLCAR